MLCRVSFAGRTVALGLCALFCACAATARETPRTRLSTKDIVERSKPAIVRVESRFGAGADQVAVATGFVVDADGRIATNLHVIQGTADIRVTLLDGSSFPVTRIAAVDPERDLAIVAIEAGAPLPVLTLGDSEVISAGDHVVAIGNPLGVLDYTVSDGLISSVRQVSPELTVLQISAPISEGSSGGPLFNRFGEVIGVATLIARDGQNLNFGIPSNYLRPLLDRDEKLSPAAFAERYRPAGRAGGGERGGGGDEGEVRIDRRVPNHDVAILDGCGEDTLLEVFRAIGDAIEIGAPLYNQGEREACFRIYEGTALRLEREVECAGLREAFGQGLLRASTLGTYTEKAWAMRDTFDGILDVILRRARGGL
jgi:serine protease Do